MKTKDKFFRVDLLWMDFSILISCNTVFAQCSQEEIDNAVQNERSRWDANADNKIGLEEAVRALQIAGGIVADIPCFVSGNPAVEVLIGSDGINYGTDLSPWIVAAKDHWENRSDDSWAQYIGRIAGTNPPPLPPDPPSPPATPSAPVCEASDGGRCFYIDALNGDDSNPGTFEEPWKTYRNFVYYYSNLLQETHIINNYGGVKPGDFFYFMSGSYFDTYIHGVESRELHSGFFVKGFDGTKTEPVTFKAYPGQHPVLSARSVVEPLSRTAEQRAIGQYDGTIIPAVKIEADKIVFDGFEVADTYGNGIAVEGENIEIKNCWIHDIDGWTNENLAGISVRAGIDIGDHGGHTNNSGNIIEFNSIVLSSDVGGRSLKYDPNNEDNPVGSLAFRNNVVVDSHVYGGHADKGIVVISTYGDDRSFS